MDNVEQRESCRKGVGYRLVETHLSLLSFNLSSCYFQQCKGKYQRAILYVSGDALRVVDEISKVS